MKLNQLSTFVVASVFALSSTQLFAKTVEAADPLYGVSAEVCKVTTPDEIRGLFTRWNDALKTLDPAKVTANYSQDAVLLPTVSNTPRTNHEEIKDYFIHFLQKQPQGEINKSYVKLGCNLAYDVGVYTFKLKAKDGLQQNVVARYSFVYEYKNGQWLISHHHSSAMPEPLGEAKH